MIQTTAFNSTPAGREKLIMELYKNAFPQVAKYVSKMGGSFDDAKDVFQDALVIYYEKAVAGGIEFKTNEKAYLYGIAKHLWLKKFRAAHHSLPLEDCTTSPELTDKPQQQPSADKLLRYLETAGKKCMDLLSAFYYHQLPMKQVAGLFGYSGERSATVQKYKCLEKIRETVKEKSLAYEDFAE